MRAGDERLMQWADVEIDNVGAAFAWSRESCDVEVALWLVSSLYPFWERRGRVREGLAVADDTLCPLRENWVTVPHLGWRPFRGLMSPGWYQPRCELLHTRLPRWGRMIPTERGPDSRPDRRRPCADS